MLESANAVHGAAGVSVVRLKPPAAGRVLSGALGTAALLSLTLGLALPGALTGQHRSRSAAAGHRLLRPQHGLASLPLGAQGPISAGLGADSPAYHVTASSGGLQAANPAQHMTESFDRSGAVVSSGKTRVGVSLSAVGYGTSLVSPGAATPRTSKNRVTYAYPGLSEWYANGPLGLEQGFTIARAPAGDASAPLTLSLALSGNAHASLASGRQVLMLSHAGGPMLRYAGLQVSDARGRTLRSWLELRAGRVLVRADTRGARYPLRIDPLIQQGEKLVGAGQAGKVEPNVGYSVALSSEGGNTAIVGGPEDYGMTGAAWVFQRSEGTWTQQGSKLTGSGESGEAKFGASVALSPDGNTALIGGPEDGKGDGAAWVFTRTESKWTQQGSKLTGSGAVGFPEFGTSVALGGSSKGDTALIGGPGDSKGVGLGEEERTGAAWVFTRTSGVWTQQGSKLLGTEESSEKSTEVEGEVVPAKFTSEFGSSVALSAEATTTSAAIGGHRDAKGAGAAWVFTRSGSTWTAQKFGTKTKITPALGEEVTSEAIPGEFGFGVAISPNSNGSTTGTLLVGAPGDNKGVGAAWAFILESSKWKQQGTKLTGAGEISEEPGEVEGMEKHPGRFGASVALSSIATTTTALMGGPGDNKGVGAAWVFTRSGTTWTAQGSKLTGSGEVSGENQPGELGWSVALSSDGNNALFGGPGDNAEVGAAWVFTRPEATWTQQGSKLTVTGAVARSSGKQGIGVALSADGNTALVGGPEDGNGAVWVYTRSGSTWTQQGAKLTGSGETGEHTKFGGSVALSSDGNTALVGGSGDNGGIGAAWVFTRSSGIWTQQGGKLTGAEGSELPKFGATVAISSDGNTALIGGPGDKSLTGAAWVFTRSGSTWTQQGSKLTGSGLSGFTEEFAVSVALSSDGNTALIGAPFDNFAAGSAFVFTRSGSTWTQQGSKLTGSGASGLAEFGASVALALEGNLALIGGPSDNGEAGAAWVFTRSGSTWTQQGSKLTGTGGSGKPEFGSSVALSSEGTVALIGGPRDSSKLGAAWVFTRSGLTWTQQGSKLTGTGAAGVIAAFGEGVALSSEGNTGLIGGQGDNNNTGAAWAFYQNFPTVVTGSVSSITQTSATLHGTVNPDGSAVTECTFEYGTTEAYGSSKPCSSLPPSGTTPVGVEASISGLTPKTTYHYRLSAGNSNGPSKGGDRTFGTFSAPTVVTGAAAPVAQTSATLNATVNPNGSEVKECKFEYGPTEAYGSSASCAQVVGSGETAVAVSAGLESLAESATYHYRIVAANGTGPSFGADKEFTTELVLGPHWYKNGVLVEEGSVETGLNILAWGSLMLENAKLGPITCQTLAGGNIANAIGGGAGKGTIRAFRAYNCVAEKCESVGGKAEVIPERLSWSSVLVEEAGVVRDKLEGIAVRVICEASSSSVQFHGTLRPKLKAGTALSAPSKLEFEAASGSLESSTEGTATVVAHLKFMGFEGNEIIKAKNP